MNDQKVLNSIPKSIGCLFEIFYFIERIKKKKIVVRYKCVIEFYFANGFTHEATLFHISSYLSLAHAHAYRGAALPVRDLHQALHAEIQPRGAREDALR